MHFFHGKVRSSPKYIRRYEKLLCIHFFNGKVCIQVHEKKYKKIEPKSKCMNSDFDCIFPREMNEWVKRGAEQSSNISKMMTNKM